MNAERDAEGLPQLKIEAHLNASAQSHSDWMAETGRFSHAGENGSSVTERIDETGFPLTGAWRTAENLAYSGIAGVLDEGEVDRMHDGLMDSAGHRDNIMHPDLSYVGIGLAVGTVPGPGNQPAVFLTQNFADTDGRVLVQEEVDGETVLQPYQGGEPVGEPQDADVPDRDDREDPSADSGGGCFVATAAYGGRAHPDVANLRRFRDEILAGHRWGRAFIRAYWIVGPRLARLVSHDRVSGRAARAVISPLARRAGAWVDRRSR